MLRFDGLAGVASVGYRLSLVGAPAIVNSLYPCLVIPGLATSYEAVLV